MAEQEEQEQTAATTLDKIREGGGQLLMLVTHRISELQTVLGQGEFERAEEIAGEIHVKLKTLAYCQSQVGTLHTTTILRATEIEQGMELQGIGTVQEISVQEEQCFGGAHTHTLVRFKIEGNEAEVGFPAEAEVLVRRQAAD